ncbi:ABC transporter permease [Paraburkholderia sediminicola]|uniref:ABC transporter permease n=1 Tax=Paraburkholderia sediminicola TaxID=458836 RepID=UPI0038BBB61C
MSTSTTSLRRHSNVAAFAPAIVLIALYAAFSVMSREFASIANLRNIVLYSALLLTVASSSALVILLGCIDLSVGAIATVAGIVTAMLVPQLGVAAALAGVLAGATVGSVNGIVHVGLRIPSFLVSLGMMTSLSGVALMLTNGAPIPVADEHFQQLARGQLIRGVPNLGLCALFVYFILGWVNTWTLFGRHVMAVGDNERVAALLGLRVGRCKILAFTLSGAVAGFAGALMTARLGTAAVSMGNSLTLQVIAAVVLGGTFITGGVGSVWRVFSGTLIISIVANGLDLLAVQPYLQTIIKGAIVLAAVILMNDRRAGLLK